MTVDETLKWVRGLTMAQNTQSKALHLLAKEVERMREERDRLYKHGVSWSTGKTVYGTEAACKELGEQLEELRRYQRQESRTATALERIAAAVEALEARSLPLFQPPARDTTDYGVACTRCGAALLGMVSVAGKAYCLDCFGKRGL